MESSFQFSNPALTYFEFVINESFDKENTKEIQIRMNMSVEVQKNEVQQKKPYSVGKRILMLIL